MCEFFFSALTIYDYAALNQLYNVMSERRLNPTDQSESVEKNTPEQEKVTDFDRGLEPETILGATDSSGQMMFLMKWKDNDKADLIPSTQANVEFPQIVIKFYEERLTWRQSSADAADA